MFPEGLQPPKKESCRSHSGSAVRPVDFPLRLPFVPNEPCEYAESESVALCTWELGTPTPEQRAELRANASQLGAEVREGVQANSEDLKARWLNLVTAPPNALARLESLLQALTSVALAEGWQPADAPELSFPPGSRYLRFTRQGQVLLAMSMPLSFMQGLSVWAFSEPAA
jgi:hypothetical protein